MSEEKAPKKQPTSTKKTEVASDTVQVKASEKITFTHVLFERGDVCNGLYINGKLHVFGDYYHDKIESFIEGFISACTWMKLNFEVNKISCTVDHINEHVVNYAMTPPENLSDITE